MLCGPRPDVDGFASPGFAATANRIASPSRSPERSAGDDLALNNVTNIIEYYRGKNEDVDIDVVTYGPGLHMLRADTSPVQDRIKRLKDMVCPGRIPFSACNNTKQGMEKAESHAIWSCPFPPIVPSAS